jgi:hypothetical protein
VAYDTTTVSNGVETHDVFFASVADGVPTRVATTTIPAQAASLNWYLSAFAPDGSKLVTLTAIDGAPLQLQVISTATGMPIAWGAPPAGTQCIGASFADPGTLFVLVLDAQGGLSVHRTTATGDAPFVNATQFFIEHIPTGAERYLFYSTTAATALAAQAPYDLHMFDLSAPSAPSVALAVSTQSTPNLSDDLSTVWFLDQYDTTTQLGALLTASLPGGQLSTVVGAAGGASFANGSNHLFYFGTSLVTSGNLFGAPLYVWSDGTSQQVDPEAFEWDSAATPPTLYVTTANPLRIYSELTP